MKEKREDDRPYEKMQKFGAGALTDAELLAVIFRTGTKNVNSVELAENVLKELDRFGGLIGIHKVQIRELLQIEGIGPVKAMQLKCIAQLSTRIASMNYRNMEDFYKPEQVAAFYMEQLRHETTEHVIAAFLNTKLKYLGDRTITVGTINSSIVSPREILIEALKVDAAYIILIHNHPSGDPTPSSEDYQVTNRMRKACDLVGIPLMDHVVIGDNRYVSLKETGTFGILHS